MSTQEAADEVKHLEEFINDASVRLSLRCQLLQENTAAVGKWPDETFFVKKDSTLKKNTVFVKKVRNFLDSQKETILTEFEQLNLSKYVEEVATAIVEAKLKMGDIPFILKLSSAMHQRYSDFGPLFLDAWKKVFIDYKDTKYFNLSKLRVDLVLFADLNTIGIFRGSEAIRLLASQLTALTNNDLDNFANMGLISSFCRHCGDDWIGLIPRRFRLLAEKQDITLPRSTFLAEERQLKCRGLFHDYLAAARTHLGMLIKEASRRVTANQQQMKNRGEVSDERQEKADQLVSTSRKFHDSLSVLADLLDADPPAQFTLASKGDLELEDDVAGSNGENNISSGLSLFDDEDTRLFYESLPDIKVMIPAILYKESEQAKPDATKQISGEEAETAAEEEIDVETVESELAKEEALYRIGATGGAAAEVSTSTGDETAPATSNPATNTEEDKQPSMAAEDIPEEDVSSPAVILMETFLTQLPKCVNRDLIDQAASNFCFNLNNRSNRRRLARALCGVPRTRYDLLPFYSRLVATLAPVMPDLVDDVNSILMADFRYWVAKRDQTHLETKLKTVRFIGELVKFGVFPTKQALDCVKMLLPNFVHHNIEMCCGLLDTCGRYLYRLAASHQRTKVYLEVMLRKKAAQHMDQAHVIAIENAYFYCNPPDVTHQASKQIELTPTMQFLRKLLWHELSRENVAYTFKMFRKINWADAELVRYVETLFSQVWNVPYTSINYLAGVLSALSDYHRNLATAVVDNVVEDIRVGMEVNVPELNQRRISMVTYFGMLYNYRLVDSSVVFKILYSLLTFGVNLDNPFTSLLDPPDSLFRVTLICNVLETCGAFLDGDDDHKKLTVFMVYFQYYFMSKRSLVIWDQPSTAELLTRQSKLESSRTGSKNSPSAPSNPPPAATGGVNANPAPSDANCPVVADAPLLATPAEANPLLALIVPQQFPQTVEQHYAETVKRFCYRRRRANSLAQAQRMLANLRSYYLPYLKQLNSNYGLIFQLEQPGQQGEQKQNGGEGGRPSRFAMDRIDEEADLTNADGSLQEEDDGADEYGDLDEEDDASWPKDDFQSRRHQRTQRGPSKKATVVDYSEETDLKTCTTTGGDLDPGADEEQVDSGDNDSRGTLVVDTSESEDEDVRLFRKPRYIRCPEDDQFQEAFERMMAEACVLSPAVALTGGQPPIPLVSSTAAGGGLSTGKTADVGSRLGAPVGPGTATSAGASLLPSPDILQLAATKAKQAVGQAVDRLSPQEALLRKVINPSAALVDLTANHVAKVNAEPLQTEAKATVPFSLVVRRGNRPHLVPLEVPETVQFAARYRLAEAAERKEKARMKQLVLEMHEAQKEEEKGGQDAALVHQIPVNVNRDRWIHYTHHKKITDADTLLGMSCKR